VEIKRNDPRNGFGRMADGLAQTFDGHWSHMRVTVTLAPRANGVRLYHEIVEVRKARAMLSESEQRRLNEIESLLQGEDPSWVRRFARTTDAITVHRRRVAAVVVAILATVSTVIGLVVTNVPIVVMSICLIGVAAGLWTYRPRGQQIDSDHQVDHDPDASAA
jgi:uncharacterized membrane protein